MKRIEMTRHAVAACLRGSGRPVGPHDSADRRPQSRTVGSRAAAIALLVALAAGTAPRSTAAQDSTGGSSDAEVAAEVTLYQLRRGSNGRQTEFDLGLVRALHGMGRTEDEIVDTVQTVRSRSRDVRPGATDEPASTLTFEIGGGFGLGPAGVEASIRYEREIRISDAEQFLDRLSPSSRIRYPRQTTNNRGERIVTVDDLTDPDQLARRRREVAEEPDALSDSERLWVQKNSIAEHGKLYEQSERYRNSFNQLFSGRIPRPDADVETIADAYPDAAVGMRLKELTERAARVDEASSEEDREKAKRDIEETVFVTLETLTEVASERAKRARQANIRQLHAAGRLGAVFISRFDPELGHQITAAHDAVTGFIDIRDTFNKAMSDGADEVLSSVVAGGSLVDLGMNLVSAFAGIKSPHQQVMEQLREIREEIARLGREMHERMDGLHDAIDGVFRALSHGQDMLRGDLAVARRMLQNQMYAIEAVRRDLEDVAWLIIESRDDIVDNMDRITFIQNDCYRERPQEELSADKYNRCLDLLGNWVENGLTLSQLDEDAAGLAGRDVNRSTTLARDRFRRALEDGEKLSAAESLSRRRLIGYRDLVNGYDAVREFLSYNHERTIHAIENDERFPRRRVFAELTAQRDGLAGFIVAIQEDVDEFRAETPSGVGALLEDMRTKIDALEKSFRDATDEFFKNSVEADGNTWDAGIPAPDFVKVIDDGNCYDESITRRTKHEVARYMMGRIHRNDLRPARAGHGRIEICVSTQNEYRLDRGWTRFNVVVDYVPGAECDGRRRIELLSARGAAQGYLAKSERKRVFLNGLLQLAERWARQGEQLPEACRYENIMDRWAKHEIEALWDAVEPAVNEAVIRADGCLVADQDYLDAWLRTAYRVGSMFREPQTSQRRVRRIGVSEEVLEMNPLRKVRVADLLRTMPPSRVLNTARAAVDRIEERLRSDAMGVLMERHAIHVFKSGGDLARIGPELTPTR